MCQLVDFQEDFQLLHGGEGSAEKEERGREGVKRVWGVGWEGGMEEAREEEWRGVMRHGERGGECMSEGGGRRWGYYIGC